MASISAEDAYLTVIEGLEQIWGVLRPALKSWKDVPEQTVTVTMAGVAPQLTKVINSINDMMPNTTATTREMLEKIRNTLVLFRAAMQKGSGHPPLKSADEALEQWIGTVEFIRDKCIAKDRAITPRVSQAIDEFARAAA